MPNGDLEVIWSVTPEQSASPYIGDIAEGLRTSGWSVERLRLADLARSRTKLVHVQWPEHVSRGPTTATTALKHLRALGLLAALSRRGHTLVVTAHNRAPHGDHDRFDDWFRARLYRLADAVVVLVDGHARELLDTGTLAPTTRTVTIPHPIHRSTDDIGRDPSGPLVVLGQIHPYHLIEPFLDALTAAGNERRVIVAGGVGDDDLVTRLERRRESWLDVRPGFVPQAELDELLRSASALVALQRNAFNTGGPFTALPRGLPVVMSASAQGAALTESVGPEWVRQVPDQPTAADIDDLDEWLERSRSHPDLSEFEIERVVAAHIELYGLLRPNTPALQF